jgi:hypothetical protein
MPDYSEYLSKPIGDIKDEVFPEGHYAARVKNYELKESAGANGKAKRPMLMVQFTLDSPYDDVDEEALGDLKVQGAVVSNNYILDAGFGLVQVKELVVAAGIPTDETQGIGTYLPQLSGQSVKLFIKQRARDDDPERMTNDIQKVLPVE